MTFVQEPTNFRSDAKWTPVKLEDLTIPAPAPGPADWNDEGVILFPSFFDQYELEAYEYEWMKAHRYVGKDPEGRIMAGRAEGWPHATPFMENPELMRLCMNSRLANAIEDALGEPGGLNLNLTGWVTTERDWHQDSYLNPPCVGDSYVACWIALDDIHPDSGPFQYVPGSHRWPQVTNEKIGQYLDMTDPLWPSHSEKLLTDLFTAKIDHTGSTVRAYLPRKGDVLFWHGRLLHRGSRANVQGMERRAVLAHYSGINHRQDMPEAVQHEAGGWYFPLANRFNPVR